MQRKNTLKKAFTLVEILIVVIILGILAAIVIPQMSNAMSEAKVASGRSAAKELVKAIEGYRNLTGTLPDLVTDWTPMTTVQQDLRGQDFGPLLPHGAPKNSLNGLTTVEDGNSAATNEVGWVYDYNSGNGSGAIWATSTDKKTLEQ